MAQFAVIGAGLAGSSIAQQLHQAGHHCLVFEKGANVGGRLATRIFDHWQVDHGTQYFTVRSEKFAEEVARWHSLDWVQPWPLQPWILQGDDLQLSADSQQRWVGAPTMNRMIIGLCEQLDIYKETRIDRMEAVAEQWRLWDEKGEHYGLFDAVILTAPLAQSLALLPDGAAAEATLRSAGMTPTWATALAMSEPSGIDIQALFSSNGIVTWAARDSAKPGRPQQYETWIIHFDRHWTSNHLEASEQLLQQQALHLLERLAGHELAPPYQSFHHRWLYARSSNAEVTIQQWDRDKRIGLAGDWTLGSRLEDAWLSAQRLGQQLLQEFSD